MAALIGVSVKPKAGGGYTCKVPIDLLSQDGVPPSEGDDVDYQVSGTVQSVTDTDATVKITSVNGEPVGGGDEAAGDEGAPPSPSTADMGAALAKGAKGQPMPF